MKLSNIFERMKFSDFEILNEKDFSTLSMLIPGRIEKDRCVFILEKKYTKKNSNYG